ncbi:MAG: DeoR/GlpR transcriptional regulator [Clostridiaceae bacterium]|nr:DeoR/GlpR transcriptional regulator [Clostridiaceae bacterium]
MRNSDINIKERRANLVKILQDEPNTSISSLSEQLTVSESTIRRDLKFLDSKKKIYTSYKLTDTGIQKDILPEFDSDIFYNTNIEEKEAIAKQAAKMIKTGDVVFINSSSTALRVIKYVDQDFVTIITNNARCLLEPVNSKVKLILIGGEIVHNSVYKNSKMCTTGDYAVSLIHNILANKCIIGISGITEEKGLSTAVISELTVNREMINSCLGHVIVVADNRKIGINHNYIFSPIENVSCLITDKNSDPEYLNQISNKGIEIIIADT